MAILIDPTTATPTTSGTVSVDNGSSAFIGLYVASGSVPSQALANIRIITPGAATPYADVRGASFARVDGPIVVQATLAATGGGTVGVFVSGGTVTPIAAPPANTVPPEVVGTAQVDVLLTADIGAWTGSPTPSYAYKWQWSADGSTGWADITGAESNSYTPVVGDVDSFLRVVVTGSNDEGSVSAASAATAAVLAAA